MTPESLWALPVWSAALNVTIFSSLHVVSLWESSHPMDGVHQVNEVGHGSSVALSVKFEKVDNNFDNFPLLCLLPYTFFTCFKFFLQI